MKPIILLVLLLLVNQFAKAQFPEAKALLGKKYHPVYDKGRYIEDYEHKVSTINGIVVRVTILFNFSKAKAIDFANVLIHNYKASSDSISYGAYITPDFSYNDFVFDENGESVMQVYDSIYYYKFVYNKNTHSIKVIHEFNEPIIHTATNLKEVFSTFKVMKADFGDGIKLKKAEIEECDIHLIFYADKNGVNGFANFWKGHNSFSAGKITDLKIVKSQKTEKTLEKTTYTFVWEYFNSYDTNTGKADVFLVWTAIDEFTTAFTCKIYIRDTQKNLYFEGYQD